MRTIWHYVRVLAVASAVAMLFYIASFFAIEFVFLRFVIPDPIEFGSGQGFVLWLYSFLLGTTLAGPGFLWIAWRMWPRAQARS